MLVRHKPQWHRHDRRGSAVVPSFIAVASRKIVKTADLLPPSHRRRGATAVHVRHKPQSHRHDHRGSAVVPSLIAVASRKIVKTADLLPPSHRTRGATAVLVRHTPQSHRHDRRGSAVVPSLIAVAQRKTVNIADLRGGTAETLNTFKTSAVLPRVGPMSVESPRHRQYRRGIAMIAAVPPCPPWHRTRTAVVPPSPPCLRSTISVQSRKRRLATLRRSRGVSTAVMAVLPRCYHITGPAVLPPIPQLCRQ